MKPYKQRSDKRELAKLILGTLAIAGVISLALVAPGAAILLKQPRRKRGREITMSDIARTVEKLAKRGYVRITQKKGEKLIGLTDMGHKKLSGLKLHDLKITKPKKWDKKWRLIIFDIPSQKRLVRDALRRKIKELGLLQIQKSTYIHPYDCFDEIRTVRDYFDLEKNLTYAVVERIENDKELRRHFYL